MEALLALAIPAVVKAVELLNKKDWQSLGKIVLALFVGAGAGLLGLFGLTDVLTGAAAGLSASGLVTVVGYASRSKNFVGSFN